MKKYLLILTLLIAGSFSGFAQEDETDPRMGKLQEKMQQYIQKRLNMNAPVKSCGSEGEIQG